MSTLQAVELGVLGPLQVRRDGAPVVIPGAKPRAILTMLGLHSGSVVSAETLIELLWGDGPPRTAAKALQTHISSLRRTLGDGFVLTAGTGWTLAESGVDASRYKSAARLGRDAAAAGDTSQAVSRFEEALALWRGIPELPDGRRGTSEKTRWIEGHAALVEDRADALLVTGRAAEIIGELEAAVADAPLRERRWGQLMLALYRAGRQGDALGAYQRARALLADELGVDPGPDLRRLETAIVGQDTALEIPAAQDLPSVTRTVTFLLTDIEGSTAAWEADADAMAVALARHDELVEQVVTSRGGRLIKTRGEGDATFSVFERASAAAAAAIELQDAIFHEPWGLQDPMRVRVALHTGEVELRDGDYFGRAVNRAARLRSLAVGGQILCSGAIAELVVDSLPDDVVLADLGMRQLKNLARPEHVFELRLETAAPPQKPNDAPIERPGLPAVLTGPGPFVGRGRELEGLVSAWQTALAGGTHAVLIAGEPGVGKTRLAGEWSQQAYQLEAIVLYGRCDEDLGAPYQPFAEALRSLVPCLGTSRLRGMRGVEALLTLVPGLTDVLPDLAAPTRADPETERYALFDAVVALLELASADAPVVLILDDLHWAAKPTLLLLRHLLRFGDRARVQIVGTYRSTDLDRSHPLAAMLADLHRGAGSGTANRLSLSGLDEADVTAYVTEAGYNDEELARALASVTGGNPFFLIEALRHVDETGGVWDPTTLPQGVRETVSRRLSRLPAETNTALAAAAVVGSRFALDLVEKVVEQDLVDAFDEACKAGIVIEEPGGRYRFNHAIVRQSLLAELPSVRRQRLHQRIATTLETQPGADDELLAELAHHYFECAWAGNAAKAVEYSRRAADQAVARLAYEGAADLYGQALHALDEIDDELPDRDDQVGELLVARCEALLAAGDVASAAGAVAKLQEATVNSPRLAAWATCFDGQLSMLIHPERLDEVETALGVAAQKLAELDDAAGEANAHTVRAACLARLGRIGDGEIALDDALTAARRARDHRRVNAVLAGAPLAALWGPNPVPRAGGRCLDVVRLLRITTDSPAVEATSTRCQAVLEAFRGRAEAARRMIDSARRTVTELGLRHALLEVEQFAGIVELIAENPTAAEPHFRQAYNGFRRMGLDADTAETAALLGRTCLALDRDTEADELCLESERLAGHALKASIAWRTLRARLLSRGHEHGEARRTAEAAVALAEHTDALVDHGDSCLTLATVLGAAGDVAGARTAAERAVDLYERKGAAALAERARRVVGERDLPSVPAPPEAPPVVELDNACIRAIGRLDTAVHAGAWGEVEQLIASNISVENRRKIVGFPRVDFPSSEYASQARRYHEIGPVRHRRAIVAIRGEHAALTRLELGTADVNPGAPQDEALQLFSLDNDGRIATEVWFDLEDMDAAIAELDAAHARFADEQHGRAPLENAASRVADRLDGFITGHRWDKLGEILADNIHADDRQRGLRREYTGRATAMTELHAVAELGVETLTSHVLAARGERIALSRVLASGGERPGSYNVEMLRILEIDADNRVAAFVTFDLDDVDAAYEELEARYLAGDAAPYAHVWQIGMESLGELNRHAPGRMTAGLVYTDHRHIGFAPGDFGRAVEELWALVPDARYRTTEVHALDAHGTVVKFVIEGTDVHGNELQWPRVLLLSVGLEETRLEVYEEDDVDAALARFEELRPQTRRLENAASRAAERHSAHFAARDWDALAKVLADDILVDDRRRVVSAGIKRGRDAEIANLRAVADVGITYMTSVVIAVRGEGLMLAHASGGDNTSEAFTNEMLGVVELNPHNQISVIVLFELDDFDSAIAELDARYIAGEGAAYARTWSVIAGAYAALNRHEFPATTPDWVNIDHRGETAFGAADLKAYLRAGLEPDQDINVYIEAVHRLADAGAVFTYAAHETSREGFDAEWRGATLMTVEGEMISRSEVFDEADFHTALARFDQLSRSAPRLENAASHAAERHSAHFAARDWDALAKVLADDFVTDDRRRVVNAGIRHGRDAEIANMQAAADVGITYTAFVVIATRGERLILTHASVGGGGGSAEFSTDVLSVVEVNSHNQIAAFVIFELDHFDDAITELDARYLAGEAASYGNVLQPVMDAVGELNRHEPGPMLGRTVFADHRRVPFGSAENYGRAIEELWTLVPDARYWTKTVHALDAHGLVSTLVIEGTDAHGNELQWGRTFLFLSDGPQVEVYEEDGVDAALARFDELRPQARQLENAASQAVERYMAHFAARDWDALAKAIADDVLIDDRRRAVNAGIQHGRDAEIANLQAAADAGFTYFASVVIAARGQRLILARASGHDNGSEEFQSDALGVAEINSHNQIAAIIVFDPDDFDAAVAELDARYIAGEATAHGQTWSVIAGAFVAHNRRELAATTADAVSIDHRRVAAYAPGQGIEYIRAGWDLGQNTRTYIEAVHRLDNLGAVITHAAHGTSQEGFDAEWRGVQILTVDGEMVNRSEVFDEEDLDAAIARFEQLTQPAPRLENSATRVQERVFSYIAAGDWDAVAQITAENVSVDDRRRVVNAGVLHGRDANIESTQATVDVGFTMTMVGALATRGEHLALFRVRVSGRDTEAIQNDALNIVEIDADERIAGNVVFDLDDFDAALAELDARYIAGEATAHAGTWSVITGSYAAFNRHEVPATEDWVTIDHRRGTPFEPSNMTPSIRTIWDLTPDLSIHIEAVHRLNNSGAVITHHGYGSSQEGFDAEWRAIDLLIVDGERINRCEVFDETDLDAALTKFDQLSRPTPRLENVACQAIERFQACFAARDWDAMAEMMAEDVLDDDRRRVVSAGVRRGRDAEITNMQAIADIGAEKLSSTVIATRGERLVLRRVHVGNDELPEPFQFPDVLQVVEIGADERFAGVVTFDLDDFDNAITELDARYIAGEAAGHARTWSVIADFLVAHNRREIAAVTGDAVSLDHRRVAGFAPGEGFEYIRAGWDLGQSLNIYIEIAHRVNDLGAVFTWAGHGTSQEGFEAEWRGVTLMTVDGEMASRMEVFDEGDLDAALARFEELQPHARRLKNAATQVYNRVNVYFAARNWAAMAEALAQNMVDHDRRRAVNAGIRRGRDVEIANSRAVAELGGEKITSIVIATRGAALALCRTCIFLRDHQLGESRIEFLSVIEIDADERLAAHVGFDFENIEAAFAELDARYLAGEAAAHSQTWSVITRAYAALNRRELPAITPDWVNIDHRRGTSFASGEMPALLDAVWNLTTDLSHSIEAVHRLNDVGAVVTNTSHETSQEGFDAEWRVITFVTVEGDLPNRCEVFDEADLDAAIAHFDELSRPARRIENAASRVHERFLACFAAGDWDAIAEIMAEDFSHDDRRPVVGAGVQYGRDAYIVDMRAVAELWNTNLESTVVAIRGERLVLMRNRLSVRDEEPEAFSTEVLAIAEIDADERGVAVVTFDVDDIDAAFEELDARYLAGEAAPHARTWSVIARIYAGFNRREPPATTPDSVFTDHRPLQNLGTVDLVAAIRSMWDVASDLNVCIEAVHRLSELGAVVTQTLKGTSQEGLDAEWRTIEIFTVEGDLLSRCEAFDESDLDAALLRFEELQPQTPRLENAASRIIERYLAHFAARDWAALAKLLADDIVSDDRRRVVNAGIRRGRDVHIADNRVVVEVSAPTMSSNVIAARGERLALAHLRIFNRGLSGEVGADVLGIAEIDADERIVALVTFDLDDIDAAYEELDARYLAGEAAEHARAWSVIARTTAAFNRHELPAADWVIIDHRPLAPIDASDLPAAIRAIWDLTPDLSTRTEAVHRLSSFGAVVTNTAYGTSPEGFAAEWRVVDLVTVEGDRISRDEFFDEADLDAALARFDELHSQPPRLENAASQLIERFRTYFAARNWAAVAENSAHEIFTDDRRSVVGSGILHGRDIDVANIRAIADLGATDLTSTVIATRGERLVLTRLRLSGRDQRPEAFHSEMLGIVEIDADNRVAARFLFDIDDIDAAFDELDARYLAGEAAAHAHIWSVIANANAAFNRHEMFPATPDWVNIDHRPVTAFAPGDMPAYIRATWDVAPDMRNHILAVHRLTGLGAVTTQTTRGISQEGFEAEWQEVALLTVDGHLLNRIEMFDEADLDAALARFDELKQPTPSFENTATRVWARAADAFNGRDVDSFLALMTADGQFEDRRKGLRAVHEGTARRKAVRAVFEEAPASWRMHAEPIAIRGSRLELTRESYCDTDDVDRPIAVELLHVMELGDDDLMRDIVSFDPDDLDDAFAELTARWIASGEVAYPEVIEAVDRINATINRHDWDSVATHFAGAEYVNHRQLAQAVDGTIADWLSSMQTTGSLVPNFWVEMAEVLARSAIGIVERLALKGTSTDGVAVEIAFVVLILLHGERVTRLEVFEEDERDAALSRLQEFNRPV